MRALPVIWTIAVLLLAPGIADAHSRSESHSVWEIDDAHVDLVLTIAEADALALGAGGTGGDDAVKSSIADHAYPIAGDARCPLVPPVTTLSAAAGFRRYDLTFRCASSEDLQIHSDVLIDQIPSHVDFAQIQNVASGDFTEQLLTADQPTADVGGDPEHLRDAGFLDFVRMGVMHILTGVDHMSFLVGLVLISRRLRDLVFVITGFTLGHSLTLALAVTGVLRPHAEFIDALVALTIVLIGAENVSVATRRPDLVAILIAAALGAVALLRALGIGELPPLLVVGAGLFAANYLLVSGHARDAARLRLLITLVFGLIHGFGFAADLLELRLPTDRLAALLIGFNVGVEIGQLTLVFGALGLVGLAVRARLAAPRRLVVDVGSSALVGIGTYWFISRSFG